MSQPPNLYEQWKRKQAQQSTCDEEPEEAAGVDPVPGQLADERPLAEKPEFFQWTEERDRQIQELLETTVPGTLPAVHRQLQSIRQALQAEELAPERAHQLLGEVLGYLRQQEQQMRARPIIEHPDVQQARQEQSRALAAWQEAAEALLSFSEKRESVYLEVANYAADQGSAYLAASRRLLLECEPEPEEEAGLPEEPPVEEEDYEEDE